MVKKRPQNPSSHGTHGKKVKPESKNNGAIAKKKKRANRPKADGGLRETVESVVIAFALAFLFKTFQAEAYVIPTGSMAETLLGRHKEVHCPSCLYDFPVGASVELDDASGRLIDGRRIEMTQCPNCRRPIDAKESPVFNGDRIVVNKQVGQYQRFDVVVFKNPEEGHVNYIKRLVGLPGETIRIRQGNLWVRKGDEDRWQIARKDDPLVQKETQQLVYDDRHDSDPLISAGWPERWVPADAADVSPEAPGGWKETDNAWTPERYARTYEADASGDDWQWLRYRHFVASRKDWNALENGGLINPPEPSLVSDFCGFNVSSSPTLSSWDADSYWVGDLTINATVRVTSASEQSQLMLELVEGQDTYRCVIHLADGKIDLIRINHRTDSEGEHPETMATGQSTIRGDGEYPVTFANVDNRLLVWVNHGLVPFDAPTTIDRNFEDVVVDLPTDADLAPCGIAVRNAKVTLSELILQRDLYYRNDAFQFQKDRDGMSDPWAVPRYTSGSQEVSSPGSLNHELRHPESWADLYFESTATARERYGRYTEYRLDDDEYLMFGDNSSRSKDSRLFDYFNRPRWRLDSHRYAVKEKDLIGKALFVFWPHGVPFLNGGEGFSTLFHNNANGQKTTYPWLRLPFYPNVSRMKKIR